MFMKLLISCFPRLIHRRDKMPEHGWTYWEPPMFEVPGSFDSKEPGRRSTQFTASCQGKYRCASRLVYDMLFGHPVDPFYSVADTPVDSFPPFKPDQNVPRVLVSHHLRLCQMAKTCHTKLEIEEPFTATLEYCNHQHDSAQPGPAKRACANARNTGVGQVCAWRRRLL